MPPARPSAFEVSFAGEKVMPHSPPPNPSTSASGSTSVPKRKRQFVNTVLPEKRRDGSGLRTASYYVAPYDREILVENDSTEINGEDPDDTRNGDDDDSKPVRILTDFAFFDPRHKMEFISLSTLEEEGLDRACEGAGYVVPFYEPEFEEDAGQEDDIEDPQYLRLSAILRFTIDYENDDQPMYVETQFAWYQLKDPSEAYRAFFHPFFGLHRVIQLAISRARTHPRDDFAMFMSYVLETDGFVAENDFALHASEIRDTINDIENGKQLTQVPFIQHIIGQQSAAPGRSPPSLFRRRNQRAQPRLRRRETRPIGNIDLVVLRPEKQNPTHVTPLISVLAKGYFRENLEVIGPRPKNPDREKEVKNQLKRRQFIFDLISNAKHESNARVSFAVGDKVEPGSDWYKAATVNGRTYAAGDVVLVLIGESGGKKAPELPNFASASDVPVSATLGDYFWFAKIVKIKNSKASFAHVQWFEHSSGTILQELGDPREIFLTELCGDIGLGLILGSVTARRGSGDDFEASLGVNELHFKFMYNEGNATFKDIPPEMEHPVAQNLSLECPCCQISSLNNLSMSSRETSDGMAYLGLTYHPKDFVLYTQEGNSGPAHVGYILDFQGSKRALEGGSVKVTVKKVGRMSMSKFEGHLEGDTPDNHERHLFMTEEEETLDLTRLVTSITVFPIDVLDNLESWLALSPHHFYISWCFKSLLNLNWTTRQPFVLNSCHHCFKKKRREVKKLQLFLQQPPLPILDIFAGCGALSFGLAAGSGCLSLTNAIEISPSASLTLSNNSPDTTVHNQCVNICLKSVVKAAEGHSVPPSKNLDGRSIMPPLPGKGKFYVLAIGFPCQSHSALNMFKKAGDRKSNLILAALSFVDFYQPPFCVFENVKGFLSFNLCAVQAGRFKVEGGVEKGGLRFLYKAMIAMGYQVHCTLLQAGQFGTPQARVRFFMIGALSGYPLPDIPSPTHDFPVKDQLMIRFPNNVSIRPTRTDQGKAAHNFVSVGEAISDLPRFDWKPPGSQMKRERPGVPSLSYKLGDKFCGYTGEGVQYQHPPKTFYQIKSRTRESKNIQHITPVLPDAKADRVINVPLHDDADYRSLKGEHWEWQGANASSSVARKGFNTKLYGRLSSGGWFNTTVTNVDPTGKQCKVLNPYCKRMVTVRELARSQGFPDHFVFESLNNNDVVTMHRQIGNAVPWQIGEALGHSIRDAMMKKWLENRQQ